MPSSIATAISAGARAPRARRSLLLSSSSFAEVITPAPIAATTSVTEMAATIRSAPLVAGKFSRVTPRKDTSSAQIGQDAAQNVERIHVTES